MKAEMELGQLMLPLALACAFWVLGAFKNNQDKAWFFKWSFWWRFFVIVLSWVFVYLSVLYEMVKSGTIKL